MSVYYLLLSPDAAAGEAAAFFPGFKVVPVPNDGDCMFAALADQLCRLTGNDRSTFNAASVRHDLVEYLRLDTELLEVISKSLDPNEPIEHYLNSMAKSGTWGDGNVLSAACSIYGCRIEVYRPGSNMPITIRGEDDTVWLEQPLLLGYVNDNHYVSLVRT